MAESVYKVIELVGTSTQSWEKAASTAVKLASMSLRDLRIAEVTKLDMQIVDGKVIAYRAKLSLSFKYSPGGSEDETEPKAPKAAKVVKAPAAEPAPAKKAPRKGKKKKA